MKWSSIVIFFSAGKLTVLSGKELGTSGLTQPFERALSTRFHVSGKYLAEMWQWDLAKQLLSLISSFVGRPRFTPYPLENDALPCG